MTEFLDIGYKEPEQPKKRGRKRAFSPIGSLDSTGNTLHGMIDIALIQSCLDDDGAKPFVQDYGMVIVDECHHVSSVTFENVLKSVKAQFVYGLTATPVRKDGHQPIVFMQCGPIRYSADAKSQMIRQNFDRYLIPRFTSYHPITDDKQTITALYENLAEDEFRNRLIIDDVVKAVNQGRTPIILTNRKLHVELLKEKLTLQVNNVITLTGSDTTREKREVLQRLQDIPKEEPLIIVATGKYVGEGFDYPRLDTLFLALPISWKGLVAQYAGRLHRESEGKKDVRIYDYIDIHVPVCDSMYRKRLKGYASIGYKTISKGLPSLFDEVEGIESIPSDELIFNGKTFLHPLNSDLIHAKRSIIISSPKLCKVGRNILLNRLSDCVHGGIEVIVMTTADSETTSYMRSRGLTVKINPSLSLCTTIVDKYIVWYGGVNVLGYTSEEDNMIRIADCSLADEIINTLYSGY